jgi:hypothetical protein
MQAQEIPLFAQLTPEQVLLAEAKAKEANPQLAVIEDPSLSITNLPIIKQSSLLVSQEQFEVIWQWLPSRYRVKNPVRHFSSSKDGFSVLSIYRKCHKSAPHVLIIKTKQGKVRTHSPFLSALCVYELLTHSITHPTTRLAFCLQSEQVFGAYLTDGWRQAQKFYGSGECFLFTIYPLLRYLDPSTSLSLSFSFALLVLTSSPVWRAWVPLLLPRRRVCSTESLDGLRPTRTSS